MLLKGLSITIKHKLPSIHVSLYHINFKLLKIWSGIDSVLREFRDKFPTCI